MSEERKNARELVNFWQGLRDRIAELEQELAEQCRLHGMGAEREAALLGKVAELERQNAELQADSGRFIWWFSDTDKKDFLQTYMNGMREGWNLDRWRAAIDAALAEDQKGKAS